MTLVAWFPLNNSLKNNGTSTFNISGTPQYLAGKMGDKALSLATSINFTIPEFVGARTWSVAFWYKVNADDNLTSDWVDVLGFTDQKSDNTTNGQFRFETCYGSSKGSVGIGQYDNATYAMVTSNANAMVASKGAWHHIVAACSEADNKCYLYLDGVLNKTLTLAGGHLTGYCWIGQNNAVNGVIQDVRYYDHALSAREVNEIRKGLTMHFALKGTGTNPNLAINSQTLNGFGGKSNYTGTNSNYLLDGERICKSVCTADSTGGPYASVFSRTSAVPAVNGTTYTWSCYIRGNREMTKSVGHECGGQMTLTITTEWQYVTKTWTYNTSQYQAIVFYGNGSDRKWLEGDWIEIKNFKIEEGEIATPYIPNTNEAKYSVISTNSNIEYDLTGNGFNGTRTSIGQVGDSPRYNGCIDFTAKTSHLTMPALHVPFTEFTMAIWAYLDEDSLSTSSNTTSNPIALGGNEFARFRIGNTNTNIWVYLNNGNPYFNYTYSKSLLEEWHHYAITFKGGTACKLYVDGVLCHTATTTVASITPASGSAWKLGEYGPNSETMDGKLSDFRFYATCLSDADIKELYELSASVDNTGKMYCYNFVEG